MSEAEMAAAVDAVLGGWEIALITRGAIIPHSLKGGEQGTEPTVSEIVALMEEIEMEMLEYRIKRALIAQKITDTRAAKWEAKGDYQKAARCRRDGGRTVTSWLDGSHE